MQHGKARPEPPGLWLLQRHCTGAGESPDCDAGVSITAGGESGLIGSAGAYGWSGGYNTYFRIDPKEDLILMLFVQQAYVPADQELQFTFHNTVMQVLVD